MNWQIAKDQKNCTSLRTNYSNGNAWVIVKLTDTQSKSMKNTLAINCLNRSSNTGEGGTGILTKKNEMFCLQAGQLHYVAQLKDTKTMEIAQKSLLPNSQALTSWLEDFLAKLSVLLEKGEALTKQEELSFLTLQGFLPTKNPEILYLKMLKVYYLTTEGQLSRQSLGFSPLWGISLSGRFLTQRISESPRIGKECSLSDILEDNPDEKSFLSQTATQKLLTKL